VWNPFYKKDKILLEKVRTSIYKAVSTPQEPAIRREISSAGHGPWKNVGKEWTDLIDIFKMVKGLDCAWLISHSFSQTRGSNNLISQLEAGLELLSLQYQTTVLSESSTAGTVCLKIILVYHQWIVSKIVLRKEKAIRWTCLKTQSASPKLGCTSMEEKEWVALAYKKDTECLSTCNRTW